MSVKIRLALAGKKNQIAYRIVAIDTRTKRDGKFLEILGFYNPKLNASNKLNIEKDKIEAWRQKGAIITPAVALLIEKGTLDRPKKSKVKKTEDHPAQPQAHKKVEAQPETPPASPPAEIKTEEKPASQKSKGGTFRVLNS